MSQRKRRQGQKRRLRKYLESQTGTTNPHALVAREHVILQKIEAIDKQIVELTTALQHEATPERDTDESEKITLREQQRIHVEYLHAMRGDMAETLRVNRRIYEAIVAAP